jgi:hypothetical protein
MLDRAACVTYTHTEKMPKVFNSKIYFIGNSRCVNLNRKLVNAKLAWICKESSNILDYLFLLVFESLINKLSQNSEQGAKIVLVIDW